MMTKNTKEVEKLVKHIATKAAEDATPFAEAIDGLKAITAYLAVEHKLNKGLSEDEVEDSSFLAYRREIDEAESSGEEANGGTTATVRSRRRGRQPS